MQFYGSWSILWHCPSLGLGCRLIFSNPLATVNSVNYVILYLQSQQPLNRQKLPAFHPTPKKRWQEYTEEIYQKDLDVPDNLDSVVADLELDILESEVWHCSQTI